MTVFATSQTEKHDLSSVPRSSILLRVEGGSDVGVRRASSERRTIRTYSVLVGHRANLIMVRLVGKDSSTIWVQTLRHLR